MLGLEVTSDVYAPWCLSLQARKSIKNKQRCHKPERRTYNIIEIVYYFPSRSNVVIQNGSHMGQEDIVIFTAEA
jgi:hypothetical protein